MNELELSRELAGAARRAVAARERLEEVPQGDAAYQAAMLDYLQATVLHLAIVSVAQARQHEQLSAEVDELRARLEPPGAVH
jgi:hypothetical protein